MHSMIQTIVDQKREDLKEEKNKVSLQDLKGRINNIKTSDFKEKLTQAVKQKRIALISEVKFASPTNPNLGSKDDLLNRVKEYEKAGADAVSIITEKHFFKGDLSFVSTVKNEVKIPVLQKDFVVDEYQIYQAKSIGSDAILLIARLVDKETLMQFVKIAKKIDVEPVVEINDEADLKKATSANTDIIAVNARDLDTFKVDVQKACGLLNQTGNDYIKLGFSGIVSSKEVDLYYDAGAQGVLVGTALMKAENIKDFIGGLR